MRYSFFVATLALACSSTWLQAQLPQTFPLNGVADQRDGHYALTNATIYVNPSEKIEGGTMIIKEGRIIAVGKGLSVPSEAVAIDLKGKYIYPSFIDLSTNYGMPDPKAAGEAAKAQPQEYSNKKGAYAWNEALHPEIDAASLFKQSNEKAKEWRDLGFGTVLSHQTDGIARGSSALVLLGDEHEHELVLKAQAGAHYSFSKGVSTQSYPSSLMGMIALLRQTYYDAQWYKNNSDKEYNLSLERWNALQDLPQFFHCGGLNTFRADKIGDEFGTQYVIVGDAQQYRRIDAVKNTKAAFVVPVNFPLPYDVSDPFDAQQVSLEAMKHWELAPTNPAALAKAGIKFSLTADGLKDKSEFWANVRKAYQFGLSEEDILKALTTTPAQLVRAEKEIGTLEKGKIANFIVTSGNLLLDDCIIYHNWIKGKPHSIKAIPPVDIRGKYEIAAQGNTFYITVEGSAEAPSAKFTADAAKKEGGEKMQLSLQNKLISFAFTPKKDTTQKVQQVLRFAGTVLDNGNWAGRATLADGSWFDWTAKRTGDIEIKAKELPKRDSSVMGQVLYPFNSYGYTADNAPKQETFLFKNATVWTNEKEGIVTGTDVLVEKGKIAKIGKGLTASGAVEVDATGKHLTAGIIDEHSHICISAGVNEATQASSAEVRIGDVVNSEDVNMYRQLAGGVIGAQLLHGSANPIGGQSALIKFRWGKMPEEMKMEDAKGFIKFALGENVKQANWGDDNTSRFPQTRMGVEQVYEDYFTRAREYGEALKKDKKHTRRDLDLDAVWEILNSERFISCHSYVQSEITMLMRVAERHGFRVNTFTHILEGYKVADKMKKHGAGGSSFSDWWAYKMEVKDAIPYNPKILDTMGVVTAINSDDAEMARRLNQEAAKGVKYGGMSEEAAWKMVTLNPAKLLRIDHRTGSIRTGKDADLVLWSDNPLSIYAKAEKTLVDGICLFDAKQDLEKRKFIQSERNRLIQKMLQAKADGIKTQPAIHTHQHHYHCGDDNLNLIHYNSGE